MSTVTDLADVIGKATLEDSLKNAGGATFYRAAKTAAIVAGKEPPGPQDDIGLGRVDFNANKDLRTSALRSYLYAPRIYKDAPELFFGPFLQLGTFLKESGAPISGFTAGAIDVVTDPSTYFLPGTAGLLKGGARYAVPRVVSRLLEGGIKGVTGEALIHAAAGELETIGKLANVSEGLLTAAKAGDKAAIKEIGVAALKSGNIPAEFAEGAASLRRDAKALGTILTNSEKIAKYEKLPGGFFLQETLGKRLAAGQVSLGGFVIPDNPFKHPLTFARQVIGFTNESDRFFFPAADAIATGLDKIGAERFLRAADFKELVPEARIGLGGVIEGGKAYAPGAFKESRLLPYQVQVAHEAMVASNSAPNAPLWKVMGYENISEKDLRALHREFLQLEPGMHAEEHEFVAFKDRLFKNLNKQRETLDKNAAERTGAALEAMTANIRDVETQAIHAKALDASAAGSLQSQARTTFNDLRGIETLRYETSSFGSAMAGRVNEGSLLAHVINTGMADIFEGAYKHAGPRELARQALSDALEHPEWFTKDAASGRLLLTVDRDAIPEKSFLSKVLERSRASKYTEGLETHLRTEGFPSDIVKLSEQMRQGIDSVGENAVNEGLIQGTIAGYLTHVFRGNDKFFKEFKIFHGQEASVVEDILSQQYTGNAKIAAFLKGKDIAPIVEKARQGKATFQEARKLTEELAVKLQEGGYGRYERDAVNLYTGYMDSVNRALLFNRIAQNPAALTPLVTEEQIIAEMGAKAAKGFTNEWLAKHNVRRAMTGDTLPAAARSLFVEVLGRPRATNLRDSPLGLAETAALGLAKERAALAPGAEGTVALRKALGDSLEGQTAIKLSKELDGSTGTLKLLDRATGKPVPFDPSWATLDSYPRSLQNWKSVKAAVNRRLAARSEEAVAALSKRVAGSSAARGEFTSTKLFVFAPDHGHLAEAFRLFNRNTYNSDLMRALDRWNYRLKSVKLSLDIFHLNVVSVASFALNPTELLGYLKDDAGRLLPGVKEGAYGDTRVLRGAVYGAAGGATLAEATGNGENVGPYTMGGALYGGMLRAAERSALRGYKMLLSPENAEALHWAGLGGWSGRPDDRAIGALEDALKTLSESLAKDTSGANRFLIHPIDGVRHMLEGFNHHLFGVVQNGGKHFYFATRWAKELEKLEAQRFPRQAEILAAKLSDTDHAALIERGAAAADRFFEDYGHGKTAKSAEPVLRDMLHWAQSNGVPANNPHLRVVNAILDSPVFGDRKLVFERTLEVGSRKARAGVTDSEIYLSAAAFADPEKAVRILAHELVHVGSARALQFGEHADRLLSQIGTDGASASLREFVRLSGSEDAAASALHGYKLHYKRVESLFKDARAGLGREGESLYGLKNVHEFVAEAFSNRGFAKRLNEIKTENGKASILRDLFSSILDMLGIRANKGSVLDGLVGELDSLATKETKFGRYEPREVFGSRYTGTAPSSGLYAPSETIGFNELSEERQHLLKLDLAKQLVQAGNQAFGGLTWRYILAKPETQHLLRQGLLSPDWTTARLAGASTIALNLRTPQRVALGAALGTAVDFLQYGGDENAPRWRGPILGGLAAAGLGKFADSIAKKMVTKGDVLARESRRLYSTAIIGGLMTMEALNLALSGHHIWENPEGKKTSLDTGDGSFVAFGKPYVEVLEFAGIYEPKKYPIPIFSRAKAKGAAIPLTLINLLDNDNGFGPILAPDDYVFTADAKHSAPIKVGKFVAETIAPIGISGPTRLVGEALGGNAGGPEVRRALLRTAGFTSSSIPGLENQRIPRLNFAPVPVPTLGNPRNLLEGAFR